MPIYEYRCGSCRRRVSIFFRSFSNVSNPQCPHCQGTDLTRLMSRVSLVRGRSDAADDGNDAELGDMLSGLDEQDPRSVARWARRMSDEMGEPMEPEMHEALDRIERGEDPERVMAETDPDVDPGTGPASDDAGDLD